jgi:KDO2-lipid IV(A) lauroyltransferase
MVSKKSKKRNNRIFSNWWKHVSILLFKAIAIMPFGLIYLLSDMFFWLNKIFFRYRYSVTTANLKYAFPEKTEREIKKLRDGYYRHFCDFTFETIKMHNMSPKQMDRRIDFKGIELADKFIKEGRSVIVFAFHHNNWEWCSSVQRFLQHRVLMVYSPMRNNAPAEKFIMHSRGKWGGEAVPVHKTARVAIDYAKKNVLTALWLAADQTAPAKSPFWTMFLNREAPFFSGPERIAIKTNQPIFFQHVKKVARGKYEAHFSILFENPAEHEPNEILLTYIRKMEETIRQEPEYYLWSHRRWKHQRPKDIPLS